MADGVRSVRVGGVPGVRVWSCDGVGVCCEGACGR